MRPAERRTARAPCAEGDLNPEPSSFVKGLMGCVMWAGSRRVDLASRGVRPGLQRDPEVEFAAALVFECTVGSNGPVDRVEPPVWPVRGAESVIVDAL